MDKDIVTSLHRHVMAETPEESMEIILILAGLL